MKRRLFTILSALSMLLFVAVVVLWVRSAWRFDWVTYRSQSQEWKILDPSWNLQIAGDRGGWTKQWSIGSGDGTFIVYVASHTWPPRKAVFGYTAEAGWKVKPGLGHFLMDDVKPSSMTLGFGAERELRDGWVRKLAVPHWFLATLTAVLPLVWGARHSRQRHRMRNTLCPDCGYDVRATPERCPECGTVPAMRHDVLRR